MYRTLACVFVFAMVGFSPRIALAWQSTGATGGGQSFSNMQPSQALNQLIVLQGLYPPQTGPGGIERYLGTVRMFAGDFAPRGTAFAEGQLLSINQNQALFSLLGANYGGNGQTTFALPDLRGRTAIHAGQGPGLSERLPGDVAGAPDVTLSVDQLPAHNHGIPGNRTTGMTGENQSFGNLQPSQALRYIIATEGVYPTPNSSTGGFAFLGEVATFAGDFPPAGWEFADGQLLSVDQYDGLFSILGPIYGGDGVTTFALPDLRGRAPIGSGQGPGLSGRLRGAATGVEEIALTSAELPIHAHTVPGGGATEIAGAEQPFDNMQPSLGLHYLIATQGIYPSPDISLGEETFLGEVTLFAGDFAPRGWALAEGQLLPINQNQALFSLLGANYGGDGQVTFALPDLRGRTAIHAGTGPWQLGELVGKEQHTLSIDELPSHQHALPLPGDTDDDGDVDLDDLNNVRNHFGESGDPVVGDTLPFDGVVNLDDLNNVRNSFGQVVPIAQPVPEPATFALVCVAILVTSSTRRRACRLESARSSNSTSAPGPRCCT